MDSVRQARDTLGIPQQIDAGAYPSIIAAIEAAAQRNSDAPAFTCLDHTLGIQGLLREAQDFAAYLQNHSGLQPGDRIAIQMPNLLQYPVVVVGALMAGLVVVNTNPLYSQREIIHQFNDSGARALVVLSNMAANVAAIVDQTPVEKVIVTDIGDMLPAHRRIVINTVARYVKRMVPAFEFPDSTSFRKAMALGRAASFKRVDLQPSTLAILQYTGGTTGVAKGAMLSHSNLVANMLQSKALLETFDDGSPQTLVLPLPLYHIYAFMVSIVMMSMGGQCLLIPNPRDMDGFIKALRKHEFTGFVGINTLFASLMEHPEFSQVDFSRLRTTASGGMALNSSVGEQWHQLTGVKVHEGYGLTETSPVVSTSPRGAAQSGTIGIAVPSTEVKVVDEAGNTLGVNEPGELCVRGPQVMQGYWQRNDETEKVMDDEGFFKTGDMAVIQPDGYMRIVDRKKDMILVSGFNVYPNEIEDVLVSHPAVLEAAAVGIPDEKSGEVVKAFIVAVEGVTPDLSDIKQYCRDNLTGYKVPKQFQLMDELPKSNVGKILRRELREV